MLNDAAAAASGMGEDSAASPGRDINTGLAPVSGGLVRCHGAA